MTTLTWLCTKETAWERDWLEYLFDDVKVTEPIFVYNSSVDIEKFLMSTGPVLGLIHLSDEWSKDSTDHYSMARLVMRNYYQDLGPKVLNFPLGWMRTFPYKLIPKSIQERKYVWSFSGHVDKTTRPEMAHWMSGIAGGQGYFKRCGENWGPFEGHALNPVEMAELYDNSYFVPCPQGNCSIDSLRVCEALQAGAIPIVERSDYWKKLYGIDVPLIQLDSWSTAPTIISGLLEDLDQLESLRSKTYNWWINHIQQLKKTIKERYESC